MENPKPAIFAKINELKTTYTSLKVFQERPEVLESLPTITFRIEDDNPSYTLDGNVGTQRIVARIDIWAKTSKESGALLLALELKMKEIKYLLSSHFDILEPEVPNGLISHVTTQFIY